MKKSKKGDVEKVKKSFRLSDLKLATKLSLIIAGIIVVCLGVLILTSLNSVNKSLTKSVNGEFEGVATQNGLLVQNILNDAKTTAVDLQDYLMKSYENTAKGNFEEQFVDVKWKSNVYDVDLFASNYEAETYMLNTAWSTVRGNDDIAGIGVYFEPYKFDKDVSNYGFYVSQAAAQTNTFKTYGSYSDFSNGEYYRTAADNKKLSFTKPYEDQGIVMISASFPIIYQGDLKGVVVVDINVENFNKIKTTDEEYKTMFASILDQDATFIYDSVSIDNVGVNLAKYNTEKDMQQMNEGFDKGEFFSINTKMVDNDGKKSNATRFFYPIDAAGETWWALSGLQTNDLTKDVKSLTIIMIVIAAVATIVIVISV
ncbi:MAG: cache domain-containing protein, partial [Oscillospiraceae bacterium]